MTGICTARAATFAVPAKLLLPQMAWSNRIDHGALAGPKNGSTKMTQFAR